MKESKIDKDWLAARDVIAEHFMGLQIDGVTWAAAEAHAAEIIAELSRCDPPIHLISAIQEARR